MVGQWISYELLFGFQNTVFGDHFLGNELIPEMTSQQLTGTEKIDFLLMREINSWHGTVD